MKTDKQNTATTNIKKVGEMTETELRNIIKNVLYEILDPDFGLELTDKAKKDILESLKQKEKGEGISLQELEKQLEIN